MGRMREKKFWPPAKALVFLRAMAVFSRKPDGV